MPVGATTGTDSEGDIISVYVSGEGTWSVDETSGAITFTPDTNFTDDPTPIDYTVDDNDGNQSNEATVTIDYAPVATDDLSENNVVGSPSVINIVSNDITGDVVDITTVDIDPTDSDGDGNPYTLEVVGEGLWVYDPSTGDLTFTPEDGFTTDPTAITYTVEDNEGNVSNIATVTVEYEEVPPVANDDSIASQTTGTAAVLVDISGDDTLSDGSPVYTDPTSPTYNADISIDPSNSDGDDDPLTLDVPGEGVWVYDPSTDDLTFTPDPGFTADPTPIEYTLTEIQTGLSDTATVTVDYDIVAPIAEDDLSTGNEPGLPVSIDPLADNGNGADSDPDGMLDATTVSLVVPTGATSVVTDANGDITSFDVSGEGTWNVDSLTGVITFIPITGFIVDPTPISYTIEDNDGNESNSALLTIQMIPQADISVVKTDNNGGYVAGTTSVYTITVTNNGPSDATNVVVIDNVPAGIPASIVTWAGNGTSGTGDLNNTILVLENGETMVYTVYIDVPTDFTGVIINIASATSDVEDPDPSNNISTDSNGEGILAALVVTKTVDNSTPIVGEDVVFTIRVTNNGPSDATGINLVDKLPTGYTVSSVTPAVVDQGSYDPISGLWIVGSLEYLESTTMLVTATVNNFGDYTNIAEIVSANQGDPNSIHGNNDPSENDQDDATIIPIPVADLRLTKTVVDDITSTEVGNQVTFEIRVYNDGAAMATGVQVTDLLPSGYDYVNYSSSIGTYNPLTGLWNIGFIEKDNTAILLVDVIVLENGDYMNCAEITAANEADVDSTPGNGDTTEDDYGCASVSPVSDIDLGITKTVVANNVTPMVGSEITFEIRLINNGDVDASEVVVTDLLPSGYTFVNYSSTRGTYSEISGLWDVGNILDGDTEVLLIDVIVNASGDYTNCTTISNIHQTDIDLSNNTSCITITPIAIVDLELTKDVDIFEPEAGSNVDFTINLTNEGPSNATGVEVTDVLPSGYLFENSSATIGIYNESTGVWNVGNVENGETQTLVITAKVIGYGDWLNFAEVTSANEFDIDSSPGNVDIYEDDMDSALTNPIIELSIPEEFTPNGDGVNDVFEVGGIEILYPNFSMEIINRWGNKVYEYKHNGDPATTPQWWDGLSDGRWNFGTGELPVGTYFYTIYYNDGDRKPQTGWVYLKR